MLVQLRAAGMLKREKEPDLHLVRELYMGVSINSPVMLCPSGGAPVQPWSEGEDEGWGEPRRCEECHQPIPPERLEVFPDLVAARTVSSRRTVGRLC